MAEAAPPSQQRWCVDCIAGSVTGVIGDVVDVTVVVKEVVAT